jgi:tyrosinase
LACPPRHAAVTVEKIGRRNQPPERTEQSDQSWINCKFCGTGGTLEDNPHNNVHNFVGGIMAGAGSSRDPIFMMHHCNIDRIWWLWPQGGGADSPIRCTA